VLGVREQPGRTLLETLIDAIKSNHLLLVLDNCEHLVLACAGLVDELLRACPNLRILATSREPLGIVSETVWRVPSLAVPQPQLPPEQIANAEAVRLFTERAQAVFPMLNLDDQTLRAVADVCRRLDGIPLALELAAAHVPLLSVEQLVSRLDDALELLTRGSRLAPERQKTVRATLDWSYRLLTAPEQQLFERLAVFAGSWTLEAAEAVAGGDGLDASSVLQLLGHLVDKSLVAAERDPLGLVRYRLPEVIRQHALERLAAGSHLQGIQDRHAAYFLAVAENTQPALLGHGHLAAQARLEREHDNYRAALRRFIERADAESAQRMAGALGRFWFFRGYLAEGEAWIELLGAVYLRRGDYAAAGEQLGASLAEARAISARWWIAETAAQLGQLALEQGELAQAGSWLSESLALARDLLDQAGLARALEGIAQLVAVQRVPRDALRLAGAAAALRERMHAPLALPERSRLERRLAPARRILGEPAAEADWAEGRALPQLQAIDLALARARPEPRSRAARTDHGGLTTRELAVARLVAQGLTNRQIAECLVIAVGTAERHVGNILAKLDLRTRSQIAAWAVAERLVRPHTVD
jgi:predicted ATPase/DNA-binding CsgD family transcriptional regulator